MGLYGYPGFLTDFVRGSTKDFVITITRDGSPVDLTGAKFYLTLKSVKDPEIVADLEILIDPPTEPLQGRTVGKITGAQSLALIAGDYYYSVRYINPAGDPYVIDMGQVAIIEALSEHIT